MKPIDDTTDLIAALQRVNIPIGLNLKNRNQLISELAIYINELIDSNFSTLVALLYRLDISEKKLKELLKVHTTEPAGLIIAELIVERQLEKIEARKKYKPSTQSNDEEKW